MSSQNGTNTGQKITDVTLVNIANNPLQKVLSFSSNLECTEDNWQEAQKIIISQILNGRDVIVITKEDKLMNLLSDDVETTDKKYVSEFAEEVILFIPTPESDIRHRATLVKNIPLSVAKDLGNSSEFTYGNLWFLLANGDIDQEDIIADTRKLTPSAFSELPSLRHEILASPAMYDGLKILWFNPNNDVHHKIIEPLFNY